MHGMAGGISRADGAGLGPAAQHLLAAIEGRTAPVVVIGLGYVGLAVAEALTASGFHVTGHDIDARRVGLLNDGPSPDGHLDDAALARMRRAGFRATADAACLDGARIVVICVPTPLDARRMPDLSAVAAVAGDVVARLQPGALVVLESTLHPTGSQEMLGAPLRARGMVPGEDVFLAFAPEREDPGNAGHRGTAIPRVVGADDAASRRLAAAFYEAAGYAVHTVSSLAAAEAAKLVENSFRLVNIALANEFKTVFAALGLDTQEIIAAASTKPFGFMPFHPGPGAGGHCIPVDPLYLAWQAGRMGMETPLISLSARLNQAAPDRVAANVVRLAAGRRGGVAAGARVLLLGLAYKRNIDDLRESASVALLHRLGDAGIEVWWHDPFLRHWPAGIAARRVPALDAPALRGFDLAVVATDHDGPDYALVAREVGLLADARGIARRLGLDPALVAEV